jgi:hypothetical protein
VPAETGNMDATRRPAIARTHLHAALRQTKPQAGTRPVAVKKITSARQCAQQGASIQLHVITISCGN